MEKYGNKIRENVSLFVGDGNKFSATYFMERHLVTNLKDLVVKYKMKENYIIFFDYVGNSCFYLTIYSPWCFEICNQITKKLLLKDLLAVQLLEPKDEVSISDNCKALANPSFEKGNVLFDVNSFISHNKSYVDSLL